MTMRTASESRQQSARSTLNRWIAVAVFVGPLAVLLVLFQYIPIGRMLWDTLFEYSLFNIDDRTFVGFHNFATLVTDPSIRNSFLITALFTLGVVVLVVPLAFMLALYLNTKLPARGLIRTLVFIPVVTSVVVVATVWKFLLHPQEGLANSLLSLLDLPRFGFLTDTHLALLSLIVMTVWQQLGLAAILYLSGLQGIPREVYEAAQLDGASRVKQHLHVTVPLMARTTSIVVVFMTVFALQTFAQPFIMTQGGPQESTNLIVYSIYNTGFIYQQPGLASAMTVGLIAIAVTVSAIQMRVFRANWSY